MPSKIGISGSGFIASNLSRLLINHHADLPLTSVLTRRAADCRSDFVAAEKMTNSIAEMIDKCDIVIECSGDPVHATEVATAAIAASKPVITMNAEFQVTTGSYFAGKGFVTEAEGDQPGCLAALREDMLMMGFKPLVYGNMKGFLNHTPTPEDMKYWSGLQGIAENQTTSFTDGTKLQIEQVLIGNFSDATILKQGLVGLASDDTVAGAEQLGRMALSHSAQSKGAAVVDYILARSRTPGVFISATHDDAEEASLRYYKLGDGPIYTLVRNYHLCAFEIVKTIRRVVSGGTVLLNNGTQPKLSVAALSKRSIAKDEVIDRSIGGYVVRGEAVQVDVAKDHVPMGILDGARVRRAIEPGQMLKWDDVELVPSRAVEIAQSLFRRPAGPLSTDSSFVAAK